MQSKKSESITLDARQLQRIRDIFEGNDEKQKVLSVIDRTRAVAGINTIIQPKSVTYTLLEPDAFVEDMVTETLRCLQPYITRNPLECLSDKNVERLFVSVDMEKVTGFHRNRKDIEESLQELEKKRFTFGWIQKSFVDVNGVKVPEKTFQYSGLLFVGHLQEDDGYYYKLHINSMALPYLLFIGLGMGYTEYSYLTYSKAKSSYVKRLYKYLCEWSNVSTDYSVSVSDFCRMMFLNDKYTNNKIKIRILDPTKEFLVKESNSLRMDYEMVYDPDMDDGEKTDAERSKTVKKKSNNTIVFHFKSIGSKTVSNVAQEVKMVRDNLVCLADKEKLPEVEAAMEALVKEQNVSLVMDKIMYYNNLVRKHEITQTKYRNIILKIVRETCGYDLRSSRHIRNAAKQSARKKKSPTP